MRCRNFYICRYLGHARLAPPPLVATACPGPPKEGELHCLYNQWDSGFVTAKFIWPEVRPGKGFPADGAGLPPRPLRRRGSYMAFIINGIAALVTAKFIWPEVRFSRLPPNKFGGYGLNHQPPTTNHQRLFCLIQTNHNRLQQGFRAKINPTTQYLQIKTHRLHQRAG